MIRERAIALLLGAGLVLAACGGGAATSVPAQTAAGGETTAPAPAETTDGGAVETEAPAATTTGGGTGTAEACELLTVDEVQQATGFANIEAQPLSDAETEALSVCGFVSNGTFPAATVSILDPENTNTDPAGYLQLPGSEEVPVNGARAVFVPAAGNMLFVIKNGRVAGVLIVPQQGELIDAVKAVVQKVADRL